MLLKFILMSFLLPCVVSSPNFVFILADDQDLLLNGLMPMKKTVELIANKGTVFSNVFANTPICCPSRSTILTGKYAHNTGVTNNSIEGNCSSAYWQNYQEPYSIAANLNQALNYVTFYAGKYLNQYGYEPSGGLGHRPKGYDWWLSLQGNSKYYDYNMSVNGSSVHRGDAPEDYYTDVVANYSIEFLNNRPRDRPFFLTAAPPAAHAPFTPAKRHDGVYKGTKALRTPSFNYTATDKHWLVRMPPKSLPENVTVLDNIQQHRQETLLAVDELVERIIRKLEEQKVLENTYIIFTSDHGFHIGQFSQPWDKREPYETDLRVPFFIRGPGVSKKTVQEYPVALVDVAPTILDLAGVDIPSYMDGESVKKYVLEGDGERRKGGFQKVVLVEYWGEHGGHSIDSRCPWEGDDTLTECTSDQWCKCQDSKNNTYTCLVDISSTQQFKLCQFEDDENFVEAYNITNDPYELNNIVETLSGVFLREHQEQMEILKSCLGDGCRGLSFRIRQNERHSFIWDTT